MARPPLEHHRWDFEVVAATGPRFASFRPYVPTANGGGTVAFVAEHRDGTTGLYRWERSTLRALAPPLRATRFYSHPALDEEGSLCVYAEAEGAQHLLLWLPEEARSVARTGLELASLGPLGPTLRAGVAALRGRLPDGAEGLFLADARGLRCVAREGALRAIQGLPLSMPEGALLFRAEREDGTEGLYLARDGAPRALLETGSHFASLGRFPYATREGEALTAATLRGGGAGLFALRDGGVRAVVPPDAGFETVRGGLLDARGGSYFYATREGAPLALFAREGERYERLLGLGDAWEGSTLAEFALNPVSLGGPGHLALRVALADGRERVLSARRRAQ